MKKRAVIQIEIDSNAEQGASSTAHNDITFGDGTHGTLYNITVVPAGQGVASNPKSILSLKTSLVHELGHVVGSLLKTPANSNDPRSKPVGNRWTDDPGDAVIASEREAWDIGKEIFPELDEREAQGHLATYTEDHKNLDITMRAAIFIEALSEVMGGSKPVN